MSSEAGRTVRDYKFDVQHGSDSRDDVPVAIGRQVPLQPLLVKEN